MNPLLDGTIEITDSVDRRSAPAEPLYKTSWPLVRIPSRDTFVKISHGHAISAVVGKVIVGTSCDFQELFTRGCRVLIELIGHRRGGYIVRCTADHQQGKGDLSDPLQVVLPRYSVIDFKPYEDPGDPRQQAPGPAAHFRDRTLQNVCIYSVILLCQQSGQKGSRRLSVNNQFLFPPDEI